VGGGGVARSASDALEGKWGVRAHWMQEMKGKEGSGDPEGQEAKSGLASSRRGLDTVTGLFLSNENTIGPAIDQLALVVREASRDR